MTSDITLAVGGGARRLTYAELARIRGISPASAERLVRRRQWPRQAGNDGRIVVLVPLSETRKASVKPRRKLSSPDNMLVGGPDNAPIRGTSGADGSPVTPTTTQSAPDTLRVLEQALGTLSEQLEHERRRADGAVMAESIAREQLAKAEQRGDDAIAMADRADQQRAEAIVRAERAEQRLDELLARQAAPDSPAPAPMGDSPLARRRWWWWR